MGGDRRHGVVGLDDRDHVVRGHVEGEQRRVGHERVRTHPDDIAHVLRGVTPGTVLGGVACPPGTRAILVVSSANRDREVWGPTADRFDISRPRRAHLSFATGPHCCIGRHFARVQLRIAVSMLLDRFPRLRLDPADEVVFRGHEYRSPTAVRVLLD